MVDPNSEFPALQIIPEVQIENGFDVLKFKYYILYRLSYDKMRSTGYLVDLPTITETYRTVDNMNIFKRSIFYLAMIFPKWYFFKTYKKKI